MGFIGVNYIGDYMSGLLTKNELFPAQVLFFRDEVFFPAFIIPYTHIASEMFGYYPFIDAERKFRNYLPVEEMVRDFLKENKMFNPQDYPLAIAQIQSDNFTGHEVHEAYAMYLYYYKEKRNIEAIVRKDFLQLHRHIEAGQIVVINDGIDKEYYDMAIEKISHGAKVPLVSMTYR